MNILMMTFLAFVVNSCEKSHHANSFHQEEMVFQIILPDADSPLLPSAEVQTKAEVSNENIQSITLFGKENTNDAFSPKPSIIINRPVQGSIWKPDTHYYWKDTSHYTFHGYAHTPIHPGSSLSLQNEGRTVNITQPATYQVISGVNTTIDYLLSYSVHYKPSKIHQAIPVILEHAFSKISLYVQRAPSMNGINIKNIQISFANIKNQATLHCNKQKDYGKDNESRNEWSYHVGTSVANYAIQLKDGSPIKDSYHTATPIMDFIAIPSDHEGMKQYTLSISYEIHTGKATRSYARTFHLDKITPMWESGHHITYNFLIDNGIHLTGAVSEWITEDIIESTILPPISSKTE